MTISSIDVYIYIYIYDLARLGRQLVRRRPLRLAGALGQRLRRGLSGQGPRVEDLRQDHGLLPLVQAQALTLQGLPNQGAGVGVGQRESEELRQLGPDLAVHALHERADHGGEGLARHAVPAVEVAGKDPQRVDGGAGPIIINSYYYQ